MGRSIRHSLPQDVPQMMKIYAQAKVRMKEGGNPTQWERAYPDEQLLLYDMQLGRSFVVEEDGQVIATFVYALGEDPTYAVIYDGAWLNDSPYGTIHRIAKADGVQGVFDLCLRFCIDLCPNIRIDTHQDNAPMLALMDKYGFTHCGTIIICDGTPRLAFQKQFKEQI